MDHITILYNNMAGTDKKRADELRKSQNQSIN